MDRDSLAYVTADIVAAHVSNNSVGVGEMPDLIKRVHESLLGLTAKKDNIEEKNTPVVPIKASVKPDYLVCLNCGKKQKTLKRHLMGTHGWTPDEYRKLYGLAPSYPMASPNYSKLRSAMAREIGLGTKANRKTSSGKKANLKHRKILVTSFTKN